MLDNVYCPSLMQKCKLTRINRTGKDAKPRDLKLKFKHREHGSTLRVALLTLHNIHALDSKVLPFRGCHPAFKSIGGKEWRRCFSFSHVSVH